MKSLVPGQFTTATVRAGGGELEAQLSQGGNWQIRVRFANEPEWRLLCVGHLDGRVLAPSAPSEPEAKVRIGPLSIDFVQPREVDGVEQDLRPREFDLLAVLATEPGRLFTKDELLVEVWGHPAGAGTSTRTLDSHVSRIRMRRVGSEPLRRPCGVQKARLIGRRATFPGARLDVGLGWSRTSAPRTPTSPP